MRKNDKQRLYELVYKVGSKSLNEINSKRLDEIDWDNLFNDVMKQCVSPEVVAKHLNNTIEHKVNPKVKFGKEFPYVHPSTVKKTVDVDIEKLKPTYRKEGGDIIIDIKTFIDEITKPPKSILTKDNVKYLHTSDQYTLVIGVAIPAFKALIYDIEESKFYVITTCPTAGQCVKYCYGMSGNYIRLPAVAINKTQIINYMLNYPNKFKRQLYHEIMSRVMSKPNITRLLIRWNEVGDFFGNAFYNMAKDITEKVKEELEDENISVEGYAYTKNNKYATIKDSIDNIKKIFSLGAIPKSVEDVLTHDKNGDINITYAEVVPKKLFFKPDIFKLKKNNRHYDKKEKEPPEFVPGGEEKLRKILIDNYDGYNDIKITEDNLYNAEDLKNVPETDTKDKVAFVIPYGTDAAAFRKDIKLILLLEH